MKNDQSQQLPSDVEARVDFRKRCGAASVTSAVALHSLLFGIEEQQSWDEITEYLDAIVGEVNLGLKCNLAPENKHQLKTALGILFQVAVDEELPIDEVIFIMRCGIYTADEMAVKQSQKRPRKARRRRPYPAVSLERAVFIVSNSLGYFDRRGYNVPLESDEERREYQVGIDQRGLCLVDANTGPWRASGTEFITHRIELPEGMKPRAALSHFKGFTEVVYVIEEVAKRQWEAAALSLKEFLAVPESRGPRSGTGCVSWDREKLTPLRIVGWGC